MRAASPVRPGSHRGRPSPHAGATSACCAQADRIATATRQLAPHVEQRLPQRRRAARRSGRASAPRPRRPSRRRRGSGSARWRRRGRRASTSKWTTFGPAASASASVAGTADVHAGEATRRGQRGRQEIGGEFAIERRCRRCATAPARARRRTTRARCPAGGRRSSARVRRPTACAPACPSAKARRRCDAGIGERDAERQRPGDLRLDVLRRPEAARRSRRRTRRGRRARRRRSSTSTDARGSRSPLIRIAPSSATSTPATPCIHCASTLRAALRCGSCGAAGSSGRHRSTRAAAASASRCGRLPTPVAIPAASSVVGMKFVVYGRRSRRSRKADVEILLWCARAQLGALAVGSRRRARGRARGLVDAPGRRRERAVVVRVGRGLWSRCSRRDRGDSRCCASSRRRAVVVSVVVDPVDDRRSARRSQSRRRSLLPRSRSRHRSRKPGNALAYGDETTRSRCVSRRRCCSDPFRSRRARGRRGHRVRPAAARRRSGRASARSCSSSGSPSPRSSPVRSHALSRRWVVLVPAGVVVVDPLILAGTRH